VLFHTVRFAIFLLLVVAAVALARGNSARKAVLLAASYIFYMQWSVVLLLPLLVTTVLDYFVALAIDRSADVARRRTLLAFSLTANLGMLAWFKYAGFFASLAGASLSFSVLLPVGISFYTFHTMSYTIDVYRRELAPCRSPLDFALFITFFPVLVAGPILRAKQFLPQLRERIALQLSPPIVLLFARGLAKKVLIADNVAPFVDGVFADPGSYPSALVWLATIAFAVQIYGDFSGYSDMARALAALFGFEIPRNFEHPYVASNPREFWQRWHISLSTWLRDYLYLPLGGRNHRIRNVLITMLLGGLWHGASWNFVLWGAIHGVLLIGHRFIRGIVFAYLLLLTWIVFRVRDSATLVVALRKFVLFDFDFHLGGSGITGLFAITAMLAVTLFAMLHVWAARRGELDVRLAQLPMPALLAFAVIAGALFALFWPSAQTPFLYFQF
jgi:alginate O-acetyltransferase complex protein AlgI